MTTILFLFISILLVVLCGLFVAAEFSLIAVSRTTIDRLAAKGDVGAVGIKRALGKLNAQLSGAQVGITITSLTIGFLAEPAIARSISPLLESIGIQGDLKYSIAITIGIALATVVTMIFGELVPKNMAITNPLAVARFIQKPIRFFSRLIRFPIQFLNGSANFVLRRFGVNPVDELATARSADELLSLVKHSSNKGTLSKTTAIMLEKSLNFGDLSADEVMTPRVRMQTLSGEDTTQKIVELAKSTGLSRFPVVGENLDDIIGVVHVKHVMSIPRPERNKTKVSQIMQPAVFVPSNIQLDVLLDHLRNGGLQMAIVIDEFGGTDGVVTIEDLFEELVGEVRDEHDRHKAIVNKCEDGSWTFSGLLRPDEISEEIGIYLPEAEDSDTVAGLIIFYLERMPRVGDEVCINVVGRSGTKMSALLKVEKMDSHRVDSIRMTVSRLVKSCEEKS
jgi:CBS domain containing-hemolysin-like protein